MSIVMNSPIFLFVCIFSNTCHCASESGCL